MFRITISSATVVCDVNVMSPLTIVLIIDPLTIVLITKNMNYSIINKQLRICSTIHYESRIPNLIIL